ncbi:MAG: hypothetical protein GVY12_16940 [Bacteroidetes bacterium]|jgi:uncharacterized protein YjbI with pentapeptide repeats|nr:hypothetical protein [Bacteroidota bacterium]
MVSQPHVRWVYLVSSGSSIGLIFSGLLLDSAFFTGLGVLVFLYLPYLASNIMLSLRKWIIRFAEESPTKFTMYVALLALLVVSLLDLVYADPTSGAFWTGVLVEAHGLVFDLFVVTLLLGGLERLRKKRLRKKLEIQSYHDLIDDLRHLETPEAARQIASAIRRLNERDVAEIDLHDCYLRGMTFESIKLTKGANLKEADFRDVEIGEAIFRGANLFGAKFQDADLRGADFTGATIWGAQFDGATLHHAHFDNANTTDGAEFGPARSSEEEDVECSISFCKARLARAHFCGAVLKFVDFRSALNLNAGQLCEAETLGGSKLDDDLMEEIENNCRPGLLSENPFAGTNPID